MATYNSQQLALIASQEGSTRTRSIPQDQATQVSKIDKFNFNTSDDPTAALAQDDVIRLLKIKAGCTVLKVRAFWEAMGASAVADLGLEAADGSGFLDLAGSVADDPDLFTTAQIDVSASGESDAAVLQEDSPLYVLEKDCYLTLTTAGAIWASDADFDGYLEYIFPA